MRKPKMILFDYGQTLVNERYFDGIKGIEAVLMYATSNKFHRTAQEIQEFANEVNAEIGRFDPARLHQIQIEIHNDPFQRFLYESMGIELSISGYELENVFWNHAAPGIPTNHIVKLLDVMNKQGIRSGVISNISFSGKALANRINEILPENEFEMILASSDYVFRKPNKRIFQLAMIKSGLEPEDIWFCGDQVKCDIDGAYGCGMYPIWYTGASQFVQDPPDKEHLKINDWDELIQILNDLKD